jgi:hypothetical protein
MSSTILTVIVLVVMWIVVLLPMVVRRADELAEAPAEPAAPIPTKPAVPAADPRAAMLARRRRTLGTLLALVPVTAAAGMLVSSRLWLANAACDLLVAGYLGWLRAQVRRTAVVWTPRTAQRAIAPTRQPDPTRQADPARPPASTAPAHVVDLDDDDPSFAQLDEHYPRAAIA